MKNKFSLSWRSSRQPRKQRKFRYNAPLHIKGGMLKSPLSKDLRKKYSIRSIRPRKGDKVKVMRGQFKGKEGKIDSVNLKKLRIIIDKIEIIKKDGSKAFYPIDPSNIMVTELNTDDKRRLSGQVKSAQSKPTIKEDLVQAKPKDAAKQDSVGQQDKADEPRKPLGSKAAKRKDSSARAEE